jgi:hypothetical protein
MRVPHVVGRDVVLAALARELGGQRRVREALEMILA